MGQRLMSSFWFSKILIVLTAVSISANAQIPFPSMYDDDANGYYPSDTFEYASAGQVMSDEDGKLEKLILEKYGIQLTRYRYYHNRIPHYDDYIQALNRFLLEAEKRELGQRWFPQADRPYRVEISSGQFLDFDPKYRPGHIRAVVGVEAVEDFINHITTTYPRLGTKAAAEARLKDQAERLAIARAINSFNKKGYEIISCDYSDSNIQQGCRVRGNWENEPMRVSVIASKQEKFLRELLWLFPRYEKSAKRREIVIKESWFFINDHGTLQALESAMAELSPYTDEQREELISSYLNF